jgi:hemerythrin
MADAEGISVPMTGIADIDDQHQQLLACLDRLALWMSKGQGFAATFDAIATLNDYAASHFRFEEDYLRKCSYPQLEPHIEEHRRLIEELDGLTARIHQGNEASGALLKLIREWIINHIGSDDMKFARYLSQC